MISLVTKQGVFRNDHIRVCAEISVNRRKRWNQLAEKIREYNISKISLPTTNDIFSKLWSNNTNRNNI